MRSLASNRSSRPACEATATGPSRFLLIPPHAAWGGTSLLKTPADPQAVSADGAPELVQERRERHRVEHAFPDDIGNAVSVSTWCFARCFTRPPDNLGMPLATHRSESILVAPLFVARYTYPTARSTPPAGGRGRSSQMDNSYRSSGWGPPWAPLPYSGRDPLGSWRRRRWISRSISRSRMRSRFSKTRFPFPTASCTFTSPCCW